MFQEFPGNNKNDDFLDEFRQKLADQSAASIEEKRKEINHSKNVFIGAFAGVALAGVVGWLVLSPQYNNNSSVEIPVIRRPQTAVKVQPVEPGGMEIQNQDKSVYDIVEKKTTDNINVEQLLPPPETPQMPEITPPVTAENNIPIQEIEQPTETIEDLTQKAQAIIDEANSEFKEKTIATVEVAPIEPSKPAEIISAPKKEVTSQPEAITLPKKEEVKVVINEKTNNTPKGNWQLQLMSSPNKGGIEKSWTSLSKKYSALQGLSHEIEAADLGAKGTFYRLKAGNFRTQQEANKVCAEIKSLGGTCIVKKK